MCYLFIVSMKKIVNCVHHAKMDNISSKFLNMKRELESEEIKTQQGGPLAET